MKYKNFKTPFLGTGAIIASLLLLGCNDVTPVGPDCTTQPDLCATSSAVIIPGGSSSSTTIPNVEVPKLPAVADPTKAQAIYETWKTRYVAYQTTEPIIVSEFGSSEGSARIKFDVQSRTVSEAIGYGMLNAFFHGDHELMMKLYKYHQAMRPSNDRLMGWSCEYFKTVKSPGAATDAEIDVATALILAGKKYNDQYLINEAIAMINDIWTYEIKQDDFMVLPGNLGWPGDNYNPSYFAPAAFKLFAMVDPNHNWTAVVNKSYEYLNAVQAGGNGLFADWTNGAGVPTIPANNPASTNYNRYWLESVRIPWRLGWDWMWFGEPRAKAILDKMAAYMVPSTDPLKPFEGNINNIRIQYPYYIGDVPDERVWNVTPSKPSMSVLASACAMGIADSRYDAFTNNCLYTLNNQQTSNDAFDYFPRILQVMYTQFLNGMYIKPAGI